MKYIKTFDRDRQRHLWKNSDGTGIDRTDTLYIYIYIYIYI